MAGDDAAGALGEAVGASGLHTISLLRPGPGRPLAEHWAYGTLAEALDDLGHVAQRVAPGTELVLRDPSGLELMRMVRTA